MVFSSKYLPTKSGVYGTLLGLLNASNRVFVSQCIVSLVNALKNAILQGNLSIATSVLRTLVECMNSHCVSVDSVQVVLSDLLSASSSCPEFGLYLLLSSLVCLSPNFSKDPRFADLIHSAIETASQLVSSSVYLSRRDFVCPTLSALPDRLETLIICLQSLRSLSWETDVLIRPYLMEGISIPDSPDDIHTLAPIAWKFGSSTVNYIPSVFLLDDDSNWILQDLISTTIDSFSLSVGECTKALLRIPVADPNFENCLVNVLISRSIGMTDVPKAFYHSVLHRATVLQESVKPVIREVIALVAPQLTTESEWQLAELVGFLLCNNFPLEGVQLANSLRNKIADVALRTQFANSLQDKLLVEVTDPGMGVSMSDPPAEYQQMREIVRIKDGSELEVLGAIKAGGSYRLFLHALIENGSRTITHLLRLLELYGSIISNSTTHGFVATRSESQKMLLDTIVAFWGNNDFRLEKTIDVFLRNGCINALDLAQRVIPVDIDRFVSLNLVRIVVEYLVDKKTNLTKQQEERIGTEMYDIVTQELEETETELNAVFETLFAKATSEEMQRWMVKNFATHMQNQIHEKVPLLKR